MLEGFSKDSQRILKEYRKGNINRFHLRWREAEVSPSAAMETHQEKAEAGNQGLKKK